MRNSPAFIELVYEREAWQPFCAASQLELSFGLVPFDTANGSPPTVVSGRSSAVKNSVAITGHWPLTTDPLITDYSRIFSNSSPACQTLPAPSVRTRSPPQQSPLFSGAFASPPTYSTSLCPNRLIASTSEGLLIPSIGSSLAAYMSLTSRTSAP